MSAAKNDAAGRGKPDGGKPDRGKTEGGKTDRGKTDGGKTDGGKTAGGTADRELVFSRLLNAPVQLVWELWVSPEHIINWWGPDGFTTTIRKMEVKRGGEWDMTMHGPDGRDYPIKAVFLEVVRHKRIVYEHMAHFRYVATIEFESRGERTFLHWQLLFESRAYMIEVAKTYGVDSGLIQTAGRMIEYLGRQDGGR